LKSFEDFTIIKIDAVIIFRLLIKLKLLFLLLGECSTLAHHEAHHYVVFMPPPPLKLLHLIFGNSSIVPINSDPTFSSGGSNNSGRDEVNENEKKMERKIESILLCLCILILISFFSTLFFVATVCVCFDNPRRN
jgi:hypothetical protein